MVVEGKSPTNRQILTVRKTENEEREMKDFYESNAENPGSKEHQTSAVDAEAQENKQAQSAALFEVPDSKQNNAPPRLGKKAAQRCAELLESFVVDFLYEDNQLLSALSLMEIANELAGTPKLLTLCPPCHFMTFMQEFLIDQMYQSALYGEITDCLMFKYRYFSSYTHIIDADARHSYLAKKTKIYGAGDSKREPLPPIKDMDIFNAVLGDEGAGAYTLTFASSEEELLNGFSAFLSAKDKSNLRALLCKEMTNAVLYELYCCLFRYGGIPSWLERKRYILIWIRTGMMPFGLLEWLPLCDWRGE